MAIYTPLTRDDMRVILAHYHLSAGDWVPMTHGRGNSSYRVSTERGAVVLTINNEKSLDGFRSVMALTDYVHARGGRVPRVVRTAVGELTSMWNGHALAVKEYIAGEVESELSATRLGQVGRELARLHKIALPPAALGLPDVHPYGLSVVPSLLTRIGDSPYGVWLERRATEISDRLAAIGTERIPRGLIHGDLFWDNIIVCGDTAQAIIDLEEACAYYLGFDLGMAIVGTCWRSERFSLEPAAALVRGYCAVRPLDSAEWQSLLLFVEYAAIATSLWRYRQYHLRHPGHPEQDAHRDMQAAADAARALSDTNFVADCRRPG